MKYLLTILFLVTAACGEDYLIQPGTYDVQVTRDIDKCMCPSVEGTTDDQVWEITEEDTLILFGSQTYDLVRQANYLTVDRNTGDDQEFHMELYPGNDKESFGGYWRSEIVGFMLTVSSFDGDRITD